MKTEKVGAESGAQPDRITHEQAAESALRFINAYFDNPGRIKPQIRIPRDPTDDDAILMAYIKQQEARELAKHAPRSRDEICPSCQALDNNPYIDANGKRMRACGRCMIQWHVGEADAPLQPDKEKK